MQITLRGANRDRRRPIASPSPCCGDGQAGKQVVVGGIGTFEDPKTARFVVSTPGTYEVAWYSTTGATDNT